MLVGLLMALECRRELAERPINGAVKGRTAGRDLAGERCQKVIHLPRAIDETEIGTHLGPAVHGAGPDGIHRHALEVLGERELTRLAGSVSLQQADRGDRPPCGKAVRVTGRLEELVRELSPLCPGGSGW